MTWINRIVARIHCIVSVIPHASLKTKEVAKFKGKPVVFFQPPQF